MKRSSKNQPKGSPDLFHSLVWPAVTLVALAILLAAPVSGYVVVLEDGTQINTAKKYEVKGDRVILTMPNGTETSYTASEVDFERTEEVNRDANLGQARMIDTVEIDVSEGEQPEDEASLSDLAAGRGLALPEARKRRPEDGGEEGPTVPETDAGFVDLMRVERVPLEDEEVSEAILTYLGGQGHDDVRVLEGVADGRPLLLMRAGSESQVFDGLRDAANALVQMNERFPERVRAFSLLLATESEVRAGQFTLTPEKADLLVSGRLEPPGFFVRYVEF